MGKYKVQRHRNLAEPTELRIHGVGGAAPESMLNDEAFLVAGNETSGFYRVDAGNHDPVASHAEAYSWGGLTSGGGFLQTLRKSLWIVLLPYAMINAAGWMLTGKKEEAEAVADSKDGGDKRFSKEAFR
ncbi:MAG: hypothetical protein GY720_17170, partial [bacterium]|nr:hypothetical protein [bacterium]